MVFKDYLMPPMILNVYPTLREVGALGSNANCGIKNKEHAKTSSSKFVIGSYCGSGYTEHNDIIMVTIYQTLNE